MPEMSMKSWFVLAVVAVGGVSLALLGTRTRQPGAVREAAAAPRPVPPAGGVAPVVEVPKAPGMTEAGPVPGDHLRLGFVAAAPQGLTSKWSQDRLCRYTADYELGEALPQSITVSGSARDATRSFIRRDSYSRETQGKRWWLAGAARVVYFGLFIVYGLTFCFLVGTDNFSLLHPVTFLKYTLAPFAALALMAGYGAGSPLVIDNSTDRTLEIRVDGRVAAVLEPRSYTLSRVAGSRFEVEAVDGGRIVESGRLVFDSSFGQGLTRAIFGQGTYIYNIGEANRYLVSSASYIKR